MCVGVEEEATPTGLSTSAQKPMHVDLKHSSALVSLAYSTCTVVHLYIHVACTV